MDAKDDKGSVFSVERPAEGSWKQTGPLFYVERAVHECAD